MDAMTSRCDNHSMRSWPLYRKMEYTIGRDWQRHHNYEVISHLVMVAINRGLSLIIENPKGTFSYLTMYWPLKPAVVDMDRRLNGDRYKKPTQFFFVNCEPKQNPVFEPLIMVEPGVVEQASDARERSEIHPQYARRFILGHILESEYKGEIE